MSKFEDWWKKHNCVKETLRYEDARYVYESRQDEVDKLQTEIDDLQKRIDDALKNIYLECWSDEYGDFQTPSYKLIKILKGGENK